MWKHFVKQPKTASAIKYDVQKLSTDEKNRALLTAADKLVANGDKILAANREDIENGRAAGMKEAMIDRLTLTKARIDQIAEGLRQVAALPDPVGEVIDEFTRPNGNEDPQGPCSHGRHRRDL